MSALTRLKKKVKPRRDVKPGEAYIRGFGQEFHSRDFEGRPGQESAQLRKVGATLRPRRPQNFPERVAQGWRPADETQRGRDRLADAPTAVLRAYYQGRARPMIAPAGAKYAPDTPATIGGTSMTPRERSAFGIGMEQFVSLKGLQAWRQKRKLHRRADETGKVQRYTREGEAFPREIHPAKPKTALGRLRERLDKKGVGQVPIEKGLASKPAVVSMSEQQHNRQLRGLVKLGKLKEAIALASRLADDRSMGKQIVKDLYDEQRRGPQARPVSPRQMLEYKALESRRITLETRKRQLQTELDKVNRDYAGTLGIKDDEERRLAQETATKAAQRITQELAENESELESARIAEQTALTAALGEEKEVAQEKKVDELIEAGPAPMSEEEVLRKHGAPEKIGPGPAQPTAPGQEAAPGMPPEISVSLQTIQSELPNIGFPDPSELFIEAVGAVLNGYQAGLSGILKEMKPEEYERFVQWCAQANVQI